MSESEGGEKPQLPEVLKELGEKAVRRHERRPATPRIQVTIDEGKWWFDSPYHREGDEQWVALMFDAFATRSQATFRCFMIQLSELCSSDWDDQKGAWHPNEDELGAAVQIVRSTKPRNEAQACLAAQMVAVHLMQMKISSQALRNGWLEPRTCAIAGKLARTYAMLMETMAKLKGKGARQRITVKKFAQHEHKHIHLHQGGSEKGNQPHEPRGSRTPEIRAALESAERPALPCTDTSQHALPKPNHEGEEEVPSTWGRSGLRRSPG